MTTLTEPFDPEIKRRPDFVEPSEVLFGWARAIRAIHSLHALPSDWDGSGACAISSAMIASAVRFCHVMRTSNQPPASVYPLADGHIMIEWRFPAGQIVRFEVEEPGRGEFMTTYSDSRKTMFSDYHWSSEIPSYEGYGQAAGHKVVTTARSRSLVKQRQQACFSLAA